MKSLSTILVIVIFHLISSPAIGDDRYSIITLGNFHGDEVSVKNGENWLGLIANDTQAELVWGKVVITRFHDAIVDNKVEEETGKIIQFQLGEKLFSAGDKGSPIALLKGNSLTAGIVKSNRLGSNKLGKELEAGQMLTLDAKHTLIATAIAIVGAFPNPVEIRDYCVRLVVTEKGANINQTQKLFCVDRVDQDAGVAEILFTGDLDRDEIPDVILGGSSHYNVGISHLFLSSPKRGASDETWLKKVAEFQTTGC